MAANIVLPENGPSWLQLRQSDFSQIDLDGLSFPLIDITKSMLLVEPNKRPTAKDILAHPLIQDYISKL